MRETVWSLSTVSEEKLKEDGPSTRGPGCLNPWSICCSKTWRAAQISYIRTGESLKASK